MAAVLLQVLERPELNKLPKAVQNKLERCLTDLQRENGALRTQHEQLTANSEQQFFDVEKRLTDSQEQVVSHTRVYTALKYENRQLVEELNKLKGLDEESSGEKPGETQGKAKYEIEAERRELARLLEKRTQEVDNLTEDVKRLDAKLLETNTAKVALQLQLDEIQSAEVSIQHRERRVQQEKELLQNQNTWLSAELKKKTEELLAGGRDHDKLTLDLRHSLDTAKDQLARVQSEAASLKKSSETQQKRAEDLTTKLKETKDQQTSMEEKYRHQLNANVKLANLYKGAAAEAEGRNEELSRAVEELTSLVKESTEANQSQTKQLSDLQGSKVSQEAELKEQINNMEKQLEEATQHASDTHKAPSLSEEELEVMCPTAAAVAKIVKPGMKFMELYNAFVMSQDELQQERLEGRRVAAVLDQIVQEVESKAPVLRRQKDEYESLQQSMTSLCTRLEGAGKEIHGLQKESDEANRRCAALERDKQAVQTTLDDTAQQVRVLLVEVEQARGGQGAGSPAPPREDVSSAAISSSSEVISQRQVVFRNVEELQRQNQSLLGRLRALGEQREREQNDTHAARVCELQQAVDQAKQQLEAAVQQGRQQKQLADSNARQRDMYRILLTQSTGFKLPPGHQGPAQDSGPASVTTRSAPFRPADSNQATAQARAALKQVSDAFSVYKREKGENDRLMNETNDRLNKQLVDLTSQNATLTSRLSSSTRRYDMQQDSVGAYRREVDALQDKTNKMAATAQRHENIIHTVTHDLRAANEKLATAEVRGENQRKESALLRAAEERLVQEKVAVLTQQRHQHLLLTNLQSIQVALERSEVEGRQRQTEERRRLEAELSGLKTKLTQEVEQRHALGRSLDAQLLEANKQLEAQNALHQKTKELLRGAEQQVATLRQQISSSESPAPNQPSTNPRAPFRASPRVPAPAQVSQVERELAEARAAVRQAEGLTSDLRERLKNVTANVDQYRCVVLSLEDSLNKEKQARGPVEAALKESQEVQRHLEARLLQAERDKQTQQDERRKAVDAVEKQVLELRRSLQSVQSELQDAGDRAAAAVAQQQTATQDSLTQTRLASEAQGRYERELLLHAADVEALQTAKQSGQRGAAESRALEERCTSTTAELQQNRTTWTQQETRLKEEASQQQRRGEELQRQNALLHQQLEALGDKMAAAAQQKTAREGLNLSFTEEGKTTEQTLQILRFVRREKEILETRLEVAEAEALRHTLQGQHQDRDIRELQDTLNTERDRLQLTLRTLAGQEERLRKAENASGLQEQNKTLRSAAQRLEAELQQGQAKARRLEAELGPVQATVARLTQRTAALQADNKLLDDDNKRLKARAQQREVQQKEVEVEEGRRQQEEKEAQGRRLQQMTEETAKMKAELARASASASSSAGQLASLREGSARVTSERDALKADLDARNLELLEKNKTITQVKKIGRRYKTQYEELKAQHDKLVSESSAQPGPDQREVQLQQAQRDLTQARQDAETSRTDLQQAQRDLAQARTEGDSTRSLLQLARADQSQAQSQAQTEGDRTRQELLQARQEADRLKTEAQQVKAEGERARQELQQARQSSAQENQSLKTSLGQAEARAKDLEGQLDHTGKALAEREAEVVQLQQQQSSQTAQTSEAAQPQTGEELNALRQELQERRSKEELLRQQMADKEEKTKKAFMGAKQKINQLNNAKEQLCKEKEQLYKEKEDLQVGREEMEVRLNALKSQLEGRLQRQDRELRDLRQQQTHPHAEQRDDAQEQSSTKGQEQQRAAEQRQMSLKSSPAADRTSTSTSSSDPPTANIRPTPSGPAPSSKATPRASIRPMVTPATVAMPTPTATVMPTTQADSQEEGGCVSVFPSVSVQRSTSPSVPPPGLAQPISCQTTAFVQPTQQQATPPAEPANQEERPSTSSAVIGSGPKRVREDQPEAGPETDTPPEEPDQSPVTKRLRLVQRMGLEEDIDEGTGGEMEGGESQDAPDNSQELPEEGFLALAEEGEEEGGVSQSVPSDPGTLQGDAPQHDVIVIDTDSSGREEEEEEEEAERYEEEEEEEEDEEDRDGGMEEDEEERDGGMGEESNEGSGDASQPYEEEEPAQTPDPASENDDSMGGATDSAHKMADSQSGEGSSRSADSFLGDAPRELRLQPASGPAPLPPSLDPRHARLPPRRPPHPLPPRLYIQPPAPELGPPPQRQAAPLRRQSVGRGPQLTPGISSMQHFFDDDDRMVPSTPTLLVPHRTDGFAEAIHSPQVAGVPRFRFGPPEDMMQQASSSHSDLGSSHSDLGSSHSDLGQLASQGGLGMYESPLFLAAQEEESGGRSVPTTPLLQAAPVSVFTESLPQDACDTASQSVPMVTPSTGLAGPGDEGDEVFMEGESSGDDPGDTPSLPSTSQDPPPSSSPSSSSSSSSADTTRPCARPPPPRTAAPPRGLGTARTLLRRGVAFTRAGRGPYGRGNIR